MTAWFRAALAAVVLAGCAGMQDGVNSATKAAVAPTGKLRVAFITAPIFAVKDPSTGEFKGVAIDLGKDLAGRIGVAMEPVAYTATPALIAGASSGAWDVALTGMSPERAAVMDFTAPVMEAEQGFLVRNGTDVGAASQVDRAGIRVGVLEKSGADLHLSRELKNATIVRTASMGALAALLATQRAEAIAVSKSSLFVIAQDQPGSSVLEGRIFVEPMAMAVPKGRAPVAAGFVSDYVVKAKAEGRVSAAIGRAGLRGVIVAPN